jgi:hypothetical protein
MRSFTFISVATALLIQTVSAQWVQTGGPEGGTIDFLGVIGDNIVAGVGGGAVFISTDKGARWNPADSAIRTAGINAITAIGATAFAGTQKGVFVSADNGVHWSAAASTGLPASGINALATIGSRLFAGTDRGAFVSLDNGAQWTKINTGLTDTFITAFGVIGARLFAGTAQGVFLTTDNGGSWTAVDSGLTPLLFDDDGEHQSAANVDAIAIIDTTIFVGDWDCGVFFSTDNGTAWKKTGFNKYNEIGCLAAYGKAIFGGGHDGGLFTATDFGSSWTEVDSGIYNPHIAALAVCGTTIFAGTAGTGVYSSTDNGRTWAAASSGLMKMSVTQLAANGSKLFSGAYGGGLFCSTDNGNIWTSLSTRSWNKSISALTVSNETVYVGCYNEAFFSTTNGRTWVALDSGLNYPHRNSIQTLAVKGTTLFAGLWEGIVTATKQERIWREVIYGSGLPYDWKCHVESFAVKGDTVFAGISDTGVFLSADNGATWKPCGLVGIGANALTANNGRVFAATDSGLFLSADNGATWTKIAIGSGNRRFLSLVASGSNAIAGTGRGGGGIFMSTDNGATWSTAASGLADGNVAALAVNGDRVFAGIELPEYDSTGNIAKTFFGCGVWQRGLAEMTVGISRQPKEIKNSHIVFDISTPRTMCSNVIVSFFLPCREQVEVSVHDLSGRAIASLVNGALGPGTHRRTWSVAATASGCYLIGMRTGSQLLVRRITVVR